ncbi:hypothetical protein [Variovorax sp. 770b2]|uniref:hypothetical protein n=1 Tax=Variovorax sp. 770b2 TaxID=1566271 RepID=UPI0011608587|nr:hypothetical protein [Variovorax sp. 770b2]
MPKRIIPLILLLLIPSFCFAQEIVATKTDVRTLSLKKGSEFHKCPTEFNFENFNYSSDHNFLLFNYFDEKLNSILFLGFIKLSTAYNQCSKNIKIKISRDSAGKNILDINEAGQIYLTYLQDMYRVGGNTLGVRTSIAVKHLSTSREIIFPFSIKNHDSEKTTMRKIDRIGGLSSFDPSAISSEFRFISKDGKYIVPLGTSCSMEDFYMGIWNVETRKEISAKEIRDLIRKGFRCKDMFG